VRAGDSHPPSRDHCTDPLSSEIRYSLIGSPDLAETVVSWHLQIPSNPNPVLANLTARLTSKIALGRSPCVQATKNLDVNQHPVRRN
jgi:hypothetical protein